MDSEDINSKKNTLSIRLTESVVFLSTDIHTRARDRITDQRSTLLRGLLILHLVKPTKITSIEVELNATTFTAWPEGIGARRIEVTEEHRVFHASTLYFRATKSHARRTASIGPGVHYSQTDNPHYDHDHGGDGPEGSSHPIDAVSATRPSTDTSMSSINSPTRISSPTPPSRSFFLNQRMNHRLSVDSSQFRRMSLHELDERTTGLHMQQQLPPIPPYSPFALPVAPDSSHFPTAHGVNGNLDPRISVHPSTSNTIPEDDTAVSGLDTNPLIIPSAPSPPILPSTPSSPTHLDTHSPPTSPSTSHSFPRGRKRFSLSAVSNVIIDAVRSTSPRTSRFGQSRERENGRGRERSIDTTNRSGRGRTMERGEESVNLNEKHVKEKGREIIAMMLGEKGKADAPKGWKEFKKGTYTFPISFSIPGNAPPTMMCESGSVSWRLKASVHRPGTFKSKMTAVQEVITVACPAAEDTEDTENIIVERHWEQQLQYLISISGRSFHIGGTVPVTFTLMPLAKINIHRLSVFMEERVDYYTNMKRIARTDPTIRFSLLSIKGDDTYTPILPLQSDDPDALRNSPLFALVNPSEDLSEVASNLMGPGPWTLHQDLKLPGSCAQMKVTNRNRKSNIIVTHTLKLVMRVERGDDLVIDAKTGRRKLFDIVVQTPVFILSCRCNPEWICLPRYSPILEDSTDIVLSCPCRVSHPYPSQVSGPIEAIIASRQSSDSGASTAETRSLNLASMASLRQLHLNEMVMRSSSLFERLVSGQESVSGEVPPAYDGSRPPARTNGVAVRS